MAVLISIFSYTSTHGIMKKTPDDHDHDGDDHDGDGDDNEVEREEFS